MVTVRVVCTVIDKKCDKEANEGDGDTVENTVKSVDEQIRHQMYAHDF